MAGECHQTTLDQLGRIVTGKTPQSRHPEYFGGEIPFVTPTDFDGRRSIEFTERCLTERGASVVNAARIPREAIMVSCIGSDMGKSAIAGKACVTNQQINSVLVESPNNPLFVYYNLSMRKEEIRAAAGGSAQPILNKTSFGQLDILLFPIPEQRAIAHILGTLDDKIELNRRMNETLEAMAKALFESWFVDFDPVRAKAEGRPTGLPAEISDLFPDSFENSELGEIPRGWKIRSIETIIDINPKRSLLKGIVSPYLEMKNVPIKGHSIDKIINREFTSGTKFVNGDTLLARITPCLENGKTAYVDFLKEGETGWGSTEFIVLAGTSKTPNTFVYYLARSGSFRSHVIQNMVGSSGRQRVPNDSLHAYLIAIPPCELLGNFEKTVFIWMQHIKSNAAFSKILSKIRDILLPKLISGELRIPDAEKILEEIGI